MEWLCIGAAVLLALLSRSGRSGSSVEYKQGYWQGYNSYYDGEGFEQNPHRYGTTLSNGWDDGWMEAHFQETGKYTTDYD
jgi:hypothetical protein